MAAGHHGTTGGDQAALGRLPRGLVFAIARAGDALGAALVLGELGPGRELRLRVGLYSLTSTEFVYVACR